jgi:hypothetical protein
MISLLSKKRKEMFFSIFESNCDSGLVDEAEEAARKTQQRHRQLSCQW